MDRNKSKAQIYKESYDKANYSTIQIKYRPNEFDKDLLKQVAKFKGESMSEFIKKAVIARIERIENGLE